MAKRVDHCRGFTLVEVLISSAIVSLLLVMIYSAMTSSTTVYTDTSRLTNMQEIARRSMDDMICELREADLTTVIISTVNGSDSIQFRKALSYSGGVVWSTTITFSWQSSALDANANKIEDDGMLTRTQDGKSRQICHYVKYGGISFDRTGNNVVVRVTLNTAKTGGGTHETYVETSVTLRNTSE